MQQKSSYNGIYIYLIGKPGRRSEYQGWFYDLIIAVSAHEQQKYV